MPWKICNHIKRSSLMLFFLCFLEEHLANVVKEESRSDQPFNQKKFTIKSVKRFSLFTFTKINCFFK